MSQFWTKKVSIDELISEFEEVLGSNRVIHRERGDIPGITPAQDIFVPIPLEVMQAATAARAKEFCDILMNLKHRDFMNHPMHHTNVTLSCIANPSSSSYKDW